jgi:hypothetical protein
MKIFLNYGSNDALIAESVASGLSDAGYEVLIEFGGIVGGENWDRETGDAIRQSEVLVALISPTYGRSIAAIRQLKFALEYNIPILFVVIKAVDPDSAILDEVEYLDISADPVAGIPLILELIATLKSNQDVPVEKATVNLSTDDAKAVLDSVDDGLGTSNPDRIFIAYSRKQRTMAQSVYDMLIRNGKAVFWDAKIKAGATWRQTIQKALDDATHLIVIWTPEAAESDEVEREVSYALAERKVIVPILSKEIPKLPYHLHGLHYIVLEEDLSKFEAELLKAIAQFSEDDDIWQ